MISGYSKFHNFFMHNGHAQKPEMYRIEGCFQMRESNFMLDFCSPSDCRFVSAKTLRLSFLKIMLVVLYTLSSCMN
jgi:hypothetical protein